MASNRLPAHEPPPLGRAGLELVAAFKFLEAAVMSAAGLGAFGLLNPGWNDAAQEWLERLALGHAHLFAARIASHLLGYLDAASRGRLVALGLGAFLYAAVFLVEGIGLWNCKRWAEYLTVALTGSLLPFELFALHRRLTVMRAGALAVNVIVIAFLVWQLWATRRPDSLASSALPSDTVRQT